MISNQDIISLLRKREKYVSRLPSMQTGNFALFYSEVHDEYYQTFIGNNSDDFCDFKLISAKDIDDYITQIQETHYFSLSFLKDWSKMHINIQLLDEFLKKAKAIITDLKENPTHSIICFYPEVHIFHLPVVGFYAKSISSEYSHNSKVISESKALEGILNVLLKDENVFSKEQDDSTFYKNALNVSARLIEVIPKEIMKNRFFFVNKRKCITWLENGSPLIIEYGYDKGTSYFIKKIKRITSLEINQVIYDLAESFVVLHPMDEGENYPGLHHQKIDVDAFFTLSELEKNVKNSKIYINYGYSLKTYYRVYTINELNESDKENKEEYYKVVLNNINSYYSYMEVEFVNAKG